MATKFICDGTGQVIEGEVIHLGHVIKRDYCKSAAQSAKRYLEEVDELHDQVAETFQNELAKIRAHWLGTGQLNALPDYDPPKEDAS